jgi:outer membrane protein TolC
MLRAQSRRAPGRRFFRCLVSLCAAGLFLMPAGCKFTMPMDRYLLNSPPVPGPLSSGLTLPLNVTVHPGEDEASGIQRVSYQTQDEKSGLPKPDPLPSLDEKAIVVNFDLVMRRTFENNADIWAARERVRESEAALNAALRSHLPQKMRKETFKTPVAEAEVWRRRAELRKIETEKLLDAANTYYDWLAAQRGESVVRDLIQLDEKLLSRSRKLVELGESPAKLMVESAGTAREGHRQALDEARRQRQSAAIKLAYLMGLSDGALAARDKLEPTDRADASRSVEEIIAQAQTNGPGVREMQGLADAIQKGISQASRAQCLCDRTGAPIVCGRLQMAHSELQQAQLVLNALQAKLRAGVEEANSSILIGREQIVHAAAAIQHAVETYRLLDLRLSKENPEAWVRNNTYNSLLTSIQQLSRAHLNFIKAVVDHEKAQARLSIYLGTYTEPSTHTP